MKIALIILGGIAALAILGIVVIGGTVAGSYNSIVTKSNATDTAWAAVQNVYQRRYDLIPNIVETVKGAANFERGTLTDIATARASVGRVTIAADKAPASAEQLQKFEQAQGNISQALSRLMVVSENYPQLKATDQFRDLTVELEGTENRISVERRTFNETTQTYNNAISVFPGNILAGFFGFKVKPYFQADVTAQKAPAVKF